MVPCARGLARRGAALTQVHQLTAPNGRGSATGCKRKHPFGAATVGSGCDELRLWQGHRLRGAIIHPVKQELERRMRLAAEGNVRAEQEHFARTYGRFHCGRTAIQILLPPSPPAVQHLW